MKPGPAPPGITVFVGRFGSGKTEVAINYALALAEVDPDRGRAVPGQPGVALIDLDVVTPYFRSREVADRLIARGVEVIAPAMVGQHLDTPAITPQILGAIQQEQRPVVLDVGGDPQGARVLGQYQGAIRAQDHRVCLVVNPYRPFTATLEGVAAAVTEIEASARLTVTGLVSNPNLIGETTAEIASMGHARVKVFARDLGLTVSFICVEQRLVAELGIDGPRWGVMRLDDGSEEVVLIITRHFIMSWE